MQNFKAALHTEIHYDFCPPSRIVGIDHYTMKAFNGAVHTWDSYTLTSEADGVFARSWIVNVMGRARIITLRRRTSLAASHSLKN